MKRIHYACLAFISTIAFSGILYAVTIVRVLDVPTYPAQQIIDWTEQTLETTITAGYHDDVSEAANVRKRFKHAAWEPMAAFLQNKLAMNKDKQAIMFHPQPLGPPVILSEEECGEASCWRVRQSYLIPEIRNQVDFSALVATADPSHGSPFVIQSLSIGVNEY
ncbi:DotI/IcmL/TraM family protein [Legionella jordanis]|uniref:Macrophage killing protein with similarity to conjugation protein n=1 Tax=Legionella jordanis TaxID=456 RepID=A0A0W0V9H2_9GAMM|nr:DotI/IcmL/TraM family protein [Legionella jordanis]KTD16787.1 Macrophage killing protein with similarity to conjugation protein [Legionella jordanis]RMX03685.1 hypothetical protein EAW55_04780 [Legionella jordanis]RMX22253.1 hypothetical protein EAS68_01645 [Legionella jordanis]VEH11745.1 Macrophage killing protein with similarity to conjugation protein [Legionella jordanis]HAT8712945.1 hypothetical protein [Legionella jordanis]